MAHLVHMKVVARVEGASSFKDAEQAAERAVGKTFDRRNGRSVSINEATAKVTVTRWERS